MDELDKKINSIKKIELKSTEKGEIFQRILKYTEFKPIKNDVRNRDLDRLYKVNVISLFINNLFNKKFMKSTIAAIMIILLGGGTSFAAQGSLPGDVLYPVKTGVNERVVDVLTVGPSATAKWESEKFERRLQELEDLLQESNDISDEVKDQIREKLNKHLEKFEEKIAKIEEDADDDSDEDDKNDKREDVVNLKSDFEARTIAHLGIMGQLQSGRMEYDKDEIEDLIDELEEKTKEIKDDRSESENKFINNSVNSNDGASFDGQLKAVEKMIENTEAKLIRLEIDTDSDAYDLINDAKENVADAKEEKEDGSMAKAYELLFEARRDVNKADVLTRGNFKGIDLDDSDDDDSDSDDSDDDDNSEDDNTDSEDDNGKPDDNPGKGNGRDR